MQATMGKWNSLLSANALVSTLLLLLFGVLLAALFASCCVFIEIVSYNDLVGGQLDKRVRFRIGCCCWLAPTDTRTTTGLPEPPPQLREPPTKAVGGPSPEEPPQQSWQDWWYGGRTSEKSMI